MSEKYCIDHTAKRDILQGMGKSIQTATFTKASQGKNHFHVKFLPSALSVSGVGPESCRFQAGKKKDLTNSLWWSS